MAEEEKSFLEAFDEKKQASTLKTLTVLTFIGSGLGLIGAVYTFFTAKTSYEAVDKLMNGGDLDKVPSFLRGMYTPEFLEMARKSYENRIPICLLSIIAMALCIFGAIQMRKLKADGYWLWLIGELLPLFATLFFLGTAAFNGIFAWIGVLIPLIFVALYTAQRKHLS